MKPNQTIHPLKINFEIPVSQDLKLPRYVNMFIIEGANLYLIDSGVATAFEYIKNNIEKTGRKISEIKTIFLTHSHPDHIGAAKTIFEATNCNVSAPQKETEWIENTALQYQQRPVPGFNQLVAGPVKVSHAVEDGDKIKPEPGITLRAINTPGHSSGSTSWYFEEKKALFTGDAILLPGELPIFENVGDYLNSLEKIRRLNPQKIYSAWDKMRSGAEIPDLLDKSKKYILAIQEKVKKIAPRFQDNYSLDFCRSVLKESGQNEKLANSLLLKSFMACINY